MLFRSIALGPSAAASVRPRLVTPLLRREIATRSLHPDETLPVAASIPRSLPNSSGGWAIAQLWAFWVAPIVGAVLGAVIYRWVGEPGR